MSAREGLKAYDWPRLVERLGVATVVCGAVLWGCWGGLQWIGSEVFKPLVAESVKTTQALREQLPSQTEILKALAESSARQEHMHAADQTERRADHEVLQAIGRHLERICTQAEASGRKNGG